VGPSVTPFEGVIAGGALVATSNSLLNYLRARRDLNARFLTERCDAYATLLEMVERILRIKKSLVEAEARNLHLTTRPGELLRELSERGPSS
jgi:hypothetical protein